jgi:mono/diheme cytochrome c family protein
MRTNPLPMLATALLATALAAHAPLAAAPAASPPAAALPTGTPLAAAHVERGEQAFLAYCGMCHGPRGAGDGEVAAALKRSSIVVPRLDDALRLQRLGREGVLRIVREGGAHVGRSPIMPQWGDLVGPELAGSIADFVMTLPVRDTEAAQRQLEAYLKAPAGVPAEGRETYVYRCSSCHGPAGRGDGPSGRMIKRKHGVRPADLTSSRRLSRMSDRELYEMVALGGGHVGRSVYMPGWNNDLTPARIKSVVAYLRTLSRTAPRP